MNSEEKVSSKTPEEEKRNQRWPRSQRIGLLALRAASALTPFSIEIGESKTAEESDKLLDDAIRRRAWKQSQERKSSRRLLIFSLFLIPIFLISGFFLGDMLPPTGTIPDNRPILGASIGSLVWIYTVGYGSTLHLLSKKREFRDRFIIEKAQKDLKSAEDQITSETADFTTLWKVTQKRLDYYHKVATEHAEKSFFYGQIAAGTGLFILVISITLVALSNDFKMALISGSIGAIGAGLGAYIGATFIKIQERSSEQMKAYFFQPLEMSRYLAAERLLDQLDEDNKSAAVRALIENMSRQESSGENKSINAPKK